jgi:hypothetical protein
MKCPECGVVLDFDQMEVACLGDSNESIVLGVYCQACGFLITDEPDP